MSVRFSLLLVIMWFLAGCEQAQINGPVGGGNLTVEELRTSNVVISQVTTLDEAAAEAAIVDWEEFSPLIKRLFLGVTQIDTASIQETTWYLVTIDGGFDYGLDGDILATQVFGSAHALVPGARLIERNVTISPLTESAYQFVKNHLDTLDDTQLQSALDDLAQELVGDVDEDGDVDYADVLNWNRLIHNDPVLLRVAAAPLDNLTQAMSDGASDAVLSARAADFFDVSAPPGVAQAFFAANVNTPISQGKCHTCHNTSGIARNTRYIVTSGSSEAALSANVAMYKNLVTALGVERILDKASKQVSHGGGEQLPLGSASYDIFKEFLELL